MPLARYLFLASSQPNWGIVSSNHLLFLHWFFPKMIATTTAANPHTDPTTAPAIEAFSEGCWKGSAGDDVDDVDDVNTDRACVAGVPARVAVDVEVDEVDRKSVIENDVDDDEVLSATQLETYVRGRSYKELVATPCESLILYHDVKVQSGG
jgi:hypothetical protein